MSSVYSAPRTLLHRLWYEPPPSTAVEFTATSVAAARWTPGEGRVEQLAVETLPEGAFHPSPVRENLVRPEDVRRAVGHALGQLGRRASGGNIAIFLPDLAARVSVLDFDKLPDKREEVLPLIRWRLKKAVPFEVDDAAVAWQSQGPAAGTQEVLIAAAPLAVVRQYEAVLESLGYSPRFVTASSLAALGLIEQDVTSQHGTMLLRSSGRLLTIIVTSEGRLRMFRATEFPGDEAMSVEEIVSEVYGSSVYFQDHYGGTISRVFVAGFGENTAAVMQATEREVDVRPQPLLLPGMRGEETEFLGIYGMVVEQAK